LDFTGGARGIAVAGTLDVRNGAVLPNTLTLGPGATLGGGSGQPATVSGPVVLGGNATILVNGGDITISGPISGTGTLTIPFGGSQTLTFHFHGKLRLQKTKTHIHKHKHKHTPAHSHTLTHTHSHFHFDIN
jgi:hypothetical protein